MFDYLIYIFAIVGFITIAVHVLPMWIMKIAKKLRHKYCKYIYYENLNPSHNDGCVSVYKKSKMIEHVFVDSYLEKIKDEKPEICGVEDIIDMLKEKHNIKKVKRNVHDWR